MKTRLSNQFLRNYLIVFLLSILAAVCALLVMSFASSVISQTLMKNVYPASSLMRDDYTQIDVAPVVQNGGGVQVVDASYHVVYSKGLDIIKKDKLSAAEFTDFLTDSKSVGLPYHVDVQYNPKENFWLIVTFPTSIRFDFAFVFDQAAASKDMDNVVGLFIAVILFYLLLLAGFAYVFSRITSAHVTKPLRKLAEGTQRLREGDYSARVHLGLKNEFAELQDTFNDMAGKIESETARRVQSEQDRKKLILDISHDLKNPLASVEGYAELCLKKGEMGDDVKGYLEVIYKNSQRANRLLNELFELSRLDDPAYVLKLCKTDACEFLRQVCGEILPELEQAGFMVDFDIPEESAWAMIDTAQMNRVFHNLADNAIRYNLRGTAVNVSLTAQTNRITIVFADNGAGIPAAVAEDIFKPFVRAEDSRNPQTGGTGLGLAIAQKIVQAHGGTLALRTDTGQGCAFTITLPGI